MKRNFFINVIGGFVGFILALLLVNFTNSANALSLNQPAVVQSSPSNGSAPSAVPISTTFTYQGQLKTGGANVSGSCNMAFRLYDDPLAGSLIGSPITTTVSISNGLFTVNLNFGSNVFTGNARWLDIRVRCPSGVGSYMTLAPRQALTAAPYALDALSTGALQNYPVNTTAPSSGQVLKWNGSAWAPGTDAGGTAYTAGFGLALNSNQFNVVTSTIQQRVSSSCSSGNAIRVINANGTVTCEALSGGSFWSLTGNSSTISTTNFLGTIDAQPLVLKTNNAEVMRLDANQNVGIGTSSPNFGLDVEKATGHTEAKFGAAYPIYAVSDYPSIGFNLYYNGAWKFGKGSVNKYGGMIEVSPDNGAIDFFATDYGMADTTATLTPTLHINQDGNVGIGTSNPSRAPLETKGATGNTVALFGGDGTGVALMRSDPFIGFNSYYNSGWKAIAPGYGGHLGIEGDSGAMTFYVNGNASSANASESPTETMRITQNGNVAIGTTTPCGSIKLHVFEANSTFGCSSAAVLGESSSNIGVEGFSNSGTGVRGGSAGSGIGVYGSSYSNYAVYGQSISGFGVVGSSGSSTGMVGYSSSGSHIFEGIDGASNNLRFAVERATGNVLADGSFTSPADFAEMMSIKGSKDDYTPGDVLIIGPDGKLMLSDRPNAANLAGVYSAKPGFLGDTEIAAHGIEYYDQPQTQERIAVALIGIVPVKVTDENGSIQPGDLLTTSSTPGHAMKAVPVMINGVAIYPTGTILGKALESWNEGTGVIKVLITLR